MVKKNDTAKSHIKNIKANYQRIEEDLVTQLSLRYDKHCGTTGSNREKVWEDLFKRIVPKKFNVERSVFIIDSCGNCSREVDIAIYDESYTPYIFNYGVMKFIPVEAVAAVIQCKSYSLKSDTLKEWAEGIDELQTCNESIVRTASFISTKSAATQTATRPIKILCYMEQSKTTPVKEKSIEAGKHFDISMVAHLNTDSSERRLYISFSKENKDLWSIYERYNLKNKGDFKEKEGTKIKDYLESIKIENYNVGSKKENNLLSFIFQFNQMLMLINNPMFFPHGAYVNLFKEKN